MALPVSLDTVADELEGLTDEMTAFVHRKTGEVVVVSNEELSK